MHFRSTWFSGIITNTHNNADNASPRNMLHWILPSAKLSLFVVNYTFHWTLAQRLECSLMSRETWVQSQVESYQRLKKWYLIHPLVTLSIIRYVSRVKWSNPGKGVAPSPTLWCSSYRKGSLRVTLDYGHQLYFTYTFHVFLWWTLWFFSVT